MINRDCESFGKYRIIKCFIHQSASLHCDFVFLKFLDSTLFCFLDSKFWLDSTLKLHYAVLTACRFVSVGGMQVPPAYVPHTKGAGDSSHFDSYDEQPIKSLPTDKYEKEFKDF